METMSRIDLKGKFFFKRLKKKDKGYFKRLKQRYNDICINAKKYALFSEQEMINTYFELMDALNEMHQPQGRYHGT